MDWQIVPIKGSGGIDTKTDPKAVKMGKWLRAENAVFTAIDRAAKRNGYGALSLNITTGGTLSGPNLLGSFNGEALLCRLWKSLCVVWSV